MWRPRLQFSLRVLFFVLTLAAVGMGILGVRWFRQYQRQQAIESIQAVGGRIVRDASQGVDRVFLGGEYFGDDALRKLAEHLRRIPELRELDLVHVTVSDKGIESLAGLGQLEEIYLFETAVTGDGRKRLKELLPNVAIKTEQPDPIASGLAAKNIYPHAMVALAWRPDGKRLASGSGDGQARLWQRGVEPAIAAWSAHASWMFDVTYSPDGRQLATAGGDNLVRLWDSESQQLIAELPGHADDVHAVRFTPDGATLVSAGDDATLRVWDTKQRTTRQILTGHQEPIPAIAISRDGQRLASASRDDTVRVWNLATGQMIALLTDHTDDVMSVAFHPNNQQLATASYDGSVRLWEVESRRLLQTLAQREGRVYSVDFDPSGQTLASAGEDGVRIWDLTTGESRAAHDQSHVAKIAFSPLGELATTNAAGELRWLSPDSGLTLQVQRTQYGVRGFSLPIAMTRETE